MWIQIPIAAAVLCLLAGIVVAFVVRRYQEAERRSLMWVLMAAAERGISLEAAARAFGAERADGIGWRAQNLADYLEAGLPLALALKRSRNPLPPAAMLAADLGQQTGTLGPALRQVGPQIDEIEGTFREASEEFAYFVFLIVWGVGILTFIMLKIIPVFARIFQEFGLELPRVTQALIGISQAVVMYWPVFVLPMLLVLVVGMGLFGYAVYPPTHLPLFNALHRRADCALVLRWLAIAVRRQRPMAEMVRLLAGYFPLAGLRKRLERAAGRIEDGEDWSESLRQVGLIRHSEAGLFQAAERAGNLAWALEEMADSGVRRATYRLRAWLNVLFPATVLLFGGCVFFIAVGLMLPLFSLIQSLA